MKINLGPADTLHEKLQAKKGSYQKWHSSIAHHFVHWSLFTALSLLVLLLTISKSDSVYAGTTQLTESNYRILTLSTNKDTAVANGADSITVGLKSMVIFDDFAHPGASLQNPVPDCNFMNNPATPNAFKIVVDGSGITYNGELTEINCTTGMANISLTSTSAGTKTIHFWSSGKPVDYDTGLALNVTFTAPATVSTGNTTTTTSSGSTSRRTTSGVTTTTQPPTQTVSTEAINTVMVGEGAVDPTTKVASSTIKENDPIVLSGKTTPNSKVTLYIYSDPIVAETTSDKDGLWTYKVASLPVGDHRVEATVTDSTGKTSEKIEIAKFTVADAQSVSKTDKVATAAKNNRVLYLLIVLGVVTAVVIGGISFYIIKKRKGLAKA